MSTELATVDASRIKELVRAMPTEKRAAFSKALRAASQHLRDSRKNYEQAFTLSCEMVRNWWYLGGELRLLHEQGMMDMGAAQRCPPGDRVALSDIGINRNQSSRCQQLVTGYSKAELDDWLSRFYDASRYTLPTLKTAVVDARKRLAAESTTVPSDESFADGIVVGDITHVKHDGFRCIYADPPWAYSNQCTRSSTGNHYGTMSVDAICEMPVAQLAGDDAHLHLWTTNAFLFDAKRVIEAWGFEYKSCFVWVKPQMGIGNYWRVSHEFLLLGVRGNAKRFKRRDMLSWRLLDRTRHSVKPEEVRLMIEAASHGPYLELFGRRAVSGWTVVGNQVAPVLFS